MGINIRKLRKSAGYKNQTALANAVGVTQATISRWEAGADMPEYPFLLKLTRLFECTTDEILGHGGSIAASIQAPLISWVQAGAFTECIDPYQKGDYAEMVNVNTYDKPTVIALKVVGNSMDRFAPEGATIIVDYADKELMDGKMYVVRLNGNDETTFKRYRINPVRLEPYSYGDYETIIPKGDIDVVGRVVEATRKAP